MTTQIAKCAACGKPIDLTKLSIVYRLEAYHVQGCAPHPRQWDADFRMIRTVAYSAGDTLEYEESIKLIRGILERMGLGE